MIRTDIKEEQTGRGKQAVKGKRWGGGRKRITKSVNNWKKETTKLTKAKRRKNAIGNNRV
jgi:hypothetical protein